ncbi:MAG: T9SS type A sorting domain-containing protein [Saprospiraceae bacterium]
MLRILALSLLILISAVSSAQTARDGVPAYNADFAQGINFGWYNNWLDADLGRISMGTPNGDIPGIGVNSVRPGLFAWFLEEFGYDIRDSEFQLYKQLGAPNNVAIIGYPSDQQRGTEEWCSGSRTKLFKGMWEPIWDNNNGTAYNENNTYATYIHKTVEEYGDEVRFWEIWNEPDINFDGNGWKDRSFEGNWYDNDIDPCEIEIQAPIQAYVRMLRISYEVVKRLKPNDYVAVGGLGFPSFLDAIMRTTDEPNNGAVTSAYPLGGGAYFDCLSFHVYPHLEGAFREWDNDAGEFAYTRTSDQAIVGYENKLRDFEAVLADYGYDGSQYPEKVKIVTESNLPRKHFNSEGAERSSIAMQRNYILKALARSQEWGIDQFHPYQLADRETEGDANFEFDLMGFYSFINDEDIGVDDVVRLQSGVAYKTYADLLRGARYSASTTNLLALQPGVEGVGFRQPDNSMAFMVWATTDQDGNEFPSETYQVSAAFRNGNYVVAEWDFETTRSTSPVNSTIELDGAPRFIVSSDIIAGTSSTSSLAETEAIQVWPNPAKNWLTLSLDTSWSAAALEGDLSGRLIDVLGRTITVPAGELGQGRINVSRLPSGVYQLVIEADGREVVKTVVKG